MSKIREIGSKGAWRILFLALFSAIGLYACGSSEDPVVAMQASAAAGSPAGTTTPIGGFSDPGNGNTTINAANNFNQGDIVVLNNTGSTALNGQQTVVNPTPTSFQVPVPFVPLPPPSSTNPPTVTQPAGPVAGCATTGATTAITLSGTPSRLSGVAPLAVFFDATTTTATTTARPFHDLEFRWDFGDTVASLPLGSVWNTGSRAGTSPRSTAKGPVAAHVYEVPGTYTLALLVTDGTNSVSNSCLQIVVGDPNAIYAGAKTTCVNASGAIHTGCPLIPVTYADSAACIAAGRCITQPDFDAALAANLGSGKRVVFKGGDTFIASIHTTYSGTGPSEVGGYGTGKPIVQWTGAPSANGIFFIGGTGSDFRINGMEFDGQNLNGMFFMSFQNTAWTNLLLLNNYVHGWGGYLPPDWAASGGFGFFAFGNRFENPAPGMTSDMALVTGGSKAALVGNTFLMNGLGQQVVRMNNMQYFIVSDNTVSGAAGVPGNQKETIAMRSSDVRTGNFGVISGNSISVGPGYVGIFPSGANTNLGVFDVLIEGNYIFGAGSGLETNAIHTNAERITIRNNIIDATDANMSIGILLRGTNGGFSLPSKDVKVYNNTIYSAKTAGGLGLQGVSVDTDVSTGNAVINNLVYTSAFTGTAISDAAGKATLLTNTGALGSVTLNPNWTVTAPMTPLTNFTPAAGSYAIGTGTAVPVFSDFFGTVRTGNNLGAVGP